MIARVRTEISDSKRSTSTTPITGHDIRMRTKRQNVHCTAWHYRWTRDEKFTKSD